MIKRLSKICIVTGVIIFSVTNRLQAQQFEWKLDNAVFSSTDPDGAGPATGSVSFELQVRSLSGTINNITGFSFGWSWQSIAAMIPSSPGCTSPVNQPANVVLAPAFAGWQYNTINECFANTQTTSGQTFDRTAIGTLELGSINLTTTFVTVMTITMWSRGTVNPEAGYTVINSSFGINPGPFPNYEIADNPAAVYGATSLTYTTALRLGSILTPVINPNLITGINVSLFPVPVSGLLNISIVSVKSVRTDLQITDINGKLIHTVNTQINNGTTNLSIDLRAFAPGHYILSSSNPKAPIREKFVILR